MSDQNALLSVRGLTLEVIHNGGAVVKDVSFDVSPGEIVGIVGESGSGKTLATRSIIGLIAPGIRHASGSIVYKGQDTLQAGDRTLRRLRGGEIGVVFQEPMTSLNPSMTIGRQLEEGLILHTKQTAEMRRTNILHMLTRVGLKDPAGALTAYPHEFSGGMRQRIMLASVMLLKPALLIADEPTTALDVTIQKQILDLLVSLQAKHGMGLIMITHDMGVVAETADRVIVQYKGRKMEEADVLSLFETPKSPYTRALLSALPENATGDRLSTVADFMKNEAANAGAAT